MATVTRHVALDERRHVLANALRALVEAFDRDPALSDRYSLAQNAALEHAIAVLRQEPEA